MSDELGRDPRPRRPRRRPQTENKEGSGIEGLPAPEPITHDPPKETTHSDIADPVDPKASTGGP